jgi:hypothetical protein
MPRDGTFYQELGAGFLDPLDRERTARHQGHRLANMGFDAQKAARACANITNPGRHRSPFMTGPRPLPWVQG